MSLSCFSLAAPQNVSIFFWNLAFVRPPEGDCNDWISADRWNVAASFTVFRDRLWTLVWGNSECWQYTWQYERWAHGARPGVSPVLPTRQLQAWTNTGWRWASTQHFVTLNRFCSPHRKQIVEDCWDSNNEQTATWNLRKKRWSSAIHVCHAYCVDFIVRKKGCVCFQGV